MCLDSLNWDLWVRFHDRYCFQSFIDWSNIWGVDRIDPLGSRNGPSAIGPRLFGSSVVVWYVMCLDSLNWALWVRLHGRYWYQSFIDGSNIWGVDRIDPWGTEMDHPLFGCSYLVVVPSYDMSCALIFLTGNYGLDFMADIDINPSSMGPVFGVWLGATLGPSAIGPQLFGSSAVVWYVMCPDSINWALWMSFGRPYWYQSLIDGSNIWGVDHPPLMKTLNSNGPRIDPRGRPFLSHSSHSYEG